MGHGEVDLAPGNAAVIGLNQLQEISLLEMDIGEPGRRRQGTGVGDVLGVEIDAQEAGLGIVRRLQAEVEARAAAELQQLEGPADLRGGGAGSAAPGTPAVLGMARFGHQRCSRLP